MDKTENNVNIGAYISKLIDKKFPSKRAFCKKYLPLRGIEPNDEELQKMSNRLSQILKGIKAIQTYDLIPFSEILEVSIESILTAGKYNKVPNTHLTNYSISFSTDKKEWEKYIQREDKLILNYDERGKNIIDYIVEAKNYPFLKYLIDKQYISFIDNSGWQGYTFGGSTSIKKREPSNTDPLELKLKYEDDLRKKVLILAAENHDFSILIKYRARELPFMYQINRFSLFRETDYNKDLERDYIEAIATSSDEIISFFSEEFEINDQLGHSERYLYPYIAEVAEVMNHNKHKCVTNVLNSILEHNKKALRKINRMILEATSQLIESVSLNQDYPVPDTMKNEFKQSVLDDLHIDQSKHLVSFFFCRSRQNNPGFVTNIFKIGFKPSDPETTMIITKINECYEKIINYKNT